MSFGVGFGSFAQGLASGVNIGSNLRGRREDADFQREQRERLRKEQGQQDSYLKGLATLQTRYSGDDLDEQHKHLTSAIGRPDKHQAWTQDRMQQRLNELNLDNAKAAQLDRERIEAVRQGQGILARFHATGDPALISQVYDLIPDGHGGEAEALGGGKYRLTRDDGVSEVVDRDSIIQMAMSALTPEGYLNAIQESQRAAAERAAKLEDFEKEQGIKARYRDPKTSMETILVDGVPTRVQVSADGSHRVIGLANEAPPALRGLSPGSGDQTIPAALINAQRELLKYADELRTQFADKGKAVPPDRLAQLNILNRNAGLPELTQQEVTQPGWFQRLWSLVPFTGDLTLGAGGGLMPVQPGAVQPGATGQGAPQVEPQGDPWATWTPGEQGLGSQAPPVNREAPRQQGLGDGSLLRRPGLVGTANAGEAAGIRDGSGLPLQRGISGAPNALTGQLGQRDNQERHARVAQVVASASETTLLPVAQLIEQRYKELPEAREIWAARNAQDWDRMKRAIISASNKVAEVQEALLGVTSAQPYQPEAVGLSSRSYQLQ